MITSPYVHHVCLQWSTHCHHYTICSLWSVHYVCLPYSLHHIFIMYVYHAHFTICSSCMFTMITSPYVHFTMAIHNLLDVHHYHFTYYTNLSPYSSLIIIFYVGSMFWSAVGNVSLEVSFFSLRMYCEQVIVCQPWQGASSSGGWNSSLHKSNILFPFVFVGCLRQNLS